MSRATLFALAPLLLLGASPPGTSDRDFARAAAYRAAAAASMVHSNPAAYRFRGFGIVALADGGRRICGEMQGPGAWRRFIVDMNTTAAVPPTLAQAPGAVVEPFVDLSDTSVIDAEVACRSASAADKISACSIALTMNEAKAQRERFTAAWTLDCKPPAVRPKPIEAPEMHR